MREPKGGGNKRLREQMKIITLMNNNVYIDNAKKAIDLIFHKYADIHIQTHTHTHTNTHTYTRRETHIHLHKHNYK